MGSSSEATCSSSEGSASSGGSSSSHRKGSPDDDSPVVHWLTEGSPEEGLAPPHTGADPHGLGCQPSMKKGSGSIQSAATWRLRLLHAARIKCTAAPGTHRPGHGAMHMQQISKGAVLLLTPLCVTCRRPDAEGQGGVLAE